MEKRGRCPHIILIYFPVCFLRFDFVEDGVIKNKAIANTLINLFKVNLFSANTFNCDENVNVGHNFYCALITKRIIILFCQTASSL